MPLNQRMNGRSLHLERLKMMLMENKRSWGYPLMLMMIMNRKLTSLKIFGSSRAYCKMLQRVSLRTPTMNTQGS
jgi:hypothetical protein